VRFPKNSRKPQIGKILHRNSIHQRPDDANLRLKKGHFEADLMINNLMANLKTLDLKIINLS
jgi:IS30 family transposase